MAAWALVLRKGSQRSVAFFLRSYQKSKVHQPLFQAAFLFVDSDV